VASTPSNFTTDELLKPYIRGRDIKRWQMTWTGLYVIAFPYGFHPQLKKYPAILEHLMRRKGHVVSKIELLNHCWDTAFEGGPAVVEVHVHRLRRKIEHDPAHPEAIRTVRGVGYMFVPPKD